MLTSGHDNKTPPLVPNMLNGHPYGYLSSHSPAFKHGSGSCCILQNKTKEKNILLFLDLNLSEILTSSLNNNISDT
jgi:hypothetical protein